MSGMPAAVWACEEEASANAHVKMASLGEAHQYAAVE